MRSCGQERASDPRGPRNLIEMSTTRHGKGYVCSLPLYEGATAGIRVQTVNVIIKTRVVLWRTSRVRQPGTGGPLVIVVNGECDRPDKRLKSGTAADSDIGRAAALHDDDAGPLFSVEGVQVGQLLFGSEAPDLQETLGGVFEQGTVVIPRMQ